MRNHPVENLLREAVESYTAITALCCAVIVYMHPGYFLLTHQMGMLTCGALAIFGSIRAIGAIKVIKYQKGLKVLPLYELKTNQIPISKKHCFVGRGFKWEQIHTQRLAQINQIKNKRFVDNSYLYKAAREFTKNHEGSRLAKLLNSNTWLNPFRPLPELGGSSYIHGVGSKDKKIYIPQKARNTHTLVMGTTGVGKTRFSDVLINQDIRNGGAVIVVDPKGDLDLVKGMYAACRASNRLDDFRIVHLAFPEISARYNPLKNFDNVTEIATRITDSINAEGEGKQFADFAWKYVDIVNKSLLALSIEINYENISFYISRLDVLLQIYADKVMPGIDASYTNGVARVIREHDSKVDKNGAPVPPIGRTKAVVKYLKDYIEERLKANDTSDIKHLLSLYDAAVMDKTYYDKITASVGPVLSKINGSNASEIFSFKDKSREVELMDVIKNKKILYVGLNSLSNFEVAQSVGKAFLSDLVSIAGKIYNESSSNKYQLNLHVDELSEVIQESFVKILNKARGAGYCVTAYSQTIQDIEVALGLRAKAEMAKGNFSNLAVLRVENKETARLLIDTLKKVDVVSHTQVSMVTDTPHGENNTYFNTNNEDRVQMDSVDMLTEGDILALPVGQAFVKIGGNTLYKVRIPLAKEDGLAPKDIMSCIAEINGIEKIPCISNPKPMQSCVEIQEEPINTTTESNTNTTHISNSEQDVNEKQDEQKEVNEECDVTETESQQTPNQSQILVDFISWLESRINSKNRQFSIEAQRLVVCDIERYGKNVVFILPEVLVKYQSREGIPSEEMQGYIKDVCKRSSSYFIDREGEKTKVLPIEITNPVESTNSTEIIEGESV